MDATIGICTWNRADRLRQTLSHMTNLRVPSDIDWELLVVNNNSTDDTDNVIEEFAGRLPIRRVFEAKPGLSVARNRAVQEARGEIFVCTDDDIVPDPDWLVTTLATFKEHEADFVYGRLTPVWDTQAPEWYGPEFTGNFGVLDLGSEPFVATSGRESFFGANHAARREKLLELGGYCEELGMVGKTGAAEDTDLFWRAVCAGCKVVYQPASVVGHMIEAERCEKKYHRSRTWRGSECYLRSLEIEARGAPRLFGIPRYLYRMALGHAVAYAGATVTFNRSKAFFHELKLIQFFGLWRQALLSKSSGSRSLRAAGD